MLFGRRLAALALSTAALPTLRHPAAAFDMQTTLALAPLLQLSALADDIDDFLFASVLASRDSAASVPTTTGTQARRMVQGMLVNGQPLEVARQAVSLAMKAQLLTRSEGSEATGHAKEAVERLASILEYESTNSFKRDALNQVAELMRADELLFFHKTLLAAQAELDSCVGSFGEEERRGAVGLVERINIGLVDGQPRPTASERGIIRARISSAISAMPSTVGTALTPGDLIRTLNDRQRGEASVH